MAADGSERTRAAYWTGLAVVGALFAVAAFLYVGHERRRTLREWEDRLRAMAEDRHVAIEAWLEQSFSDARLLATHTYVRGSLDPRAGNPPRAADVVELIDRRRTIMGYSDAYILDAAGALRSASTGSAPPPSRVRDLARRLVADRMAHYAAFVAWPGGRPRVVFLAPISADPRDVALEPTGPALGVAVLAEDPVRWIYPLLRREPIPTRTAEALLAGREGGRLVYLSPLRHAPAAPLTFTLPLKGGLRVVAHEALEGHIGAGEGMDYRGVSVVAATYPLADTGWGLVVKVDREEALAGAHREIALVLMAGTALLSAAAFAVRLLWRRGHLKQLEAVARSEARYRLLRSAASDAVLFLGPDGKVVEANDAALALYGYTRRELLGLGAEQLKPPSSRGEMTRTLARARSGAVLVEAEHQRKNGERVFVEMSAAATSLDGQEAVVAVVRDIRVRKRAEEALRESERRRLSLLNHLPGLAYRCANDRNWTMEYLSAGCLELTGYTPEELTGSEGYPFGELIHPNDRQQVWDEVQASLARRAPYVLEYRIRTKEGEERWVWERGAGVFDGDRFLALEGFIWDITDRRRAHEALQEERNRFFTLAANAPFGLVLVGPDGRFEYVNDRFTALFGYTRADVPDFASWRRRAYPDPAYRENVERAWVADREAQGPRGSTHRTFTVACGDGSRKETHFTATALGEGRALLSLEDVTERMRAEEALRLSEERFRRFFQGNPAASYIATVPGEIVACNRAFCDLFGFATPAEALRQRASGFYADPLDREVFLEALRRERTLSFRESVYRRHDGRELVVLETASGVFDESGELTGVIGFLMDMTQRRQLEEQLRQAQKMEAVGQLAGGVAHDFNNLLLAIQGSAELIARGLGPGNPWQRELETILSVAARAADLTRQLLAFARRTVLAPEALDPGRVVRELLPMMRRLLPETIRVEFQPSDATGAIRADRTQVEQVLLNLCLNARDAMPEGGTLKVTTEDVEVGPDFLESRPWARTGSYVLLSVSDDGVGMPPEVAEKAFEPFFTTKPTGQGTGMGLATVYGVVKQHGGMVELDSAPGRGTTVRVYFPREKRLVPSQATPGPAAPSAGGTETLLVVEDESEFRRVVVEVLRSYGYRVLEASEGALALALLRRGEAVDLVVSDVVMPNMGGEALAREAARLRPGLPFLFTSGYAEDAVHHDFIRREGVHFLAKPFSMDALARKVREVLSRRGG